MKTLFRIAIILFAFTIFVKGQGTAGEDAKFEYRSLIDMPSAGILEKGFVGVSVDVLPLGVVISKIEVGVFENFSFGISYGGANIIGTGVVDWYKLPGVNARVRLLNETASQPALALGFDSIKEALGRLSVRSDFKYFVSLPVSIHFRLVLFSFRFY